MTTYVTPQEAGVSVGDFFVDSWGYDQTNVTFYKVVALTPKGMKVQEWTSKVDHSNFHDYMVPGDSPKTGVWVRDTEYGGTVYDREAPAPVEQKRLQMWGEGKVYAAASSFSSMQLWDGVPAYQTNAYAGH